jgi:hypothetical protein
MPSLPAVPHVVRADWHFSLTGDPNVQFRLFFDYAGALSLADAQTWVNAMKTAWTAHLTTDQIPSCILQFVELTDLSSSVSPQVFTTGVEAGTSGHTEGVNGLALLVKHKIARRYRGGHPRSYLPGFPSSVMSGTDAWDPTALATWQTHYNSFISDCLTMVPVAAAPATQVNVSYFSGNAPVIINNRARNRPTLRAGGPVTDNILSNQLLGTPASQRRRNETP